MIAPVFVSVPIVLKFIRAMLSAVIVPLLVRETIKPLLKKPKPPPPPDIVPLLVSVLMVPELLIPVLPPEIMPLLVSVLMVPELLIPVLPPEIVPLLVIEIELMEPDIVQCPTEVLIDAEQTVAGVA